MIKTDKPLTIFLFTSKIKDEQTGAEDFMIKSVFYDSIVLALKNTNRLIYIYLKSGIDFDK